MLLLLFDYFLSIDIGHFHFKHYSQKFNNSYFNTLKYKLAQALILVRISDHILSASICLADPLSTFNTLRKASLWNNLNKNQDTMSVEEN